MVLIEAVKPFGAPAVRGQSPPAGARPGPTGPASTCWWCAAGSLPALAELNAAGGLNGHVPITAIISLIAVVGSFLYGYDTIAMAVERSASEETVVVDGIPGQPPVLQEPGVRATPAGPDRLLHRPRTDLLLGPPALLGAGHRPRLLPAAPSTTPPSAAATPCSASRPGPTTGGAGTVRSAASWAWCWPRSWTPRRWRPSSGRDLFDDPGQIDGIRRPDERRRQAVRVRGGAARVGRGHADPVAHCPSGGTRSWWPPWPTGPGAWSPTTRCRLLVTPAPAVGRGAARRPGRGRAPPADGGGMTLDELCARRVAVWGLGREGLAMVRLLVQRGVDPAVHRRQPRSCAQGPPRPPGGHRRPGCRPPAR